MLPVVLYVLKPNIPYSYQWGSWNLKASFLRSTAPIISGYSGHVLTSFPEPLQKREIAPSSGGFGRYNLKDCFCNITRDVLDPIKDATLINLHHVGMAQYQLGVTYVRSGY